MANLNCLMNEKNTKSQAIFVFFSKYIAVFITLIVNSILARILSPEEFGTVAIISVFVAFFNIIADIGIGGAVIQSSELEWNDLNMLFTLTLYFSIILSGIFALFSYFIASFYDNNEYIELGMILSLSLFFNVLNTIPNAVLMRNQNFYLVGIRTIVCNMVSGAITIYFALRGSGCHALVIQSVCNSGMIFLWNFCNAKLKLVKNINFSCVRKIRDFSVGYFGFNLLNYFARNVDNLMIGKILGEIPLGYYDKAYKLMLYPVQNLTYVLNPILHPIMAKYRTDLRKIYTYYIKVLKILSLIGIFISAYCLFNGKEIILVFFGEKWGNSVIAFKILSTSIWFQVTNSSAGAIYASLNRTKLLLKSGLIYIPIQIFLVMIAVSRKNINIVAVAAAVGLMLKFFIDYTMLIKQGFRYSLTKFFINFKMEPLLFIICYISMVLGKVVVIANPVVILIYNFALSGSIFLLFLWITGQIKYLRM